MFKNKKIIDTYLYDEFKAIPESRIWAFIGSIINAEDREILRGWEKDFTTLGIPYIITEEDAESWHGKRVKCKKLWTERRA